MTRDRRYILARPPGNILVSLLAQLILLGLPGAGRLVRAETGQARRPIYRPASSGRDAES